MISTTAACNWACSRLGAVHEDVQNQGRSVYDGRLDLVLEVLHLTRREIIVENHQLRVQLIRRQSKLFGLAATNEGRWIW